jgi:hypothetical protein
MTKRFIAIWIALILLTFVLSENADARKLKVYGLPKDIAPGQLGIIVFQNPDPEHPKSQTKCTADKLIAWTKSDVPILRIEQNGKQVWTSLGSYQTVGDSCIATFMAPTTFAEGTATLFIVNGSDPSTPYPLTITKKIDAHLTIVDGGMIKPLGRFSVMGDGFSPEGFVDEKKAREELEGNIGLSTLSPAQQWIAVNHRIMKDWDKLSGGNFLYLEQSGKTWRCFVENCGITMVGNTPSMLLEFTAPPDIAAGPVALSLGIRMNGAEVEKTVPINTTVGQ